jgi:hypothetical protein
MILCNISQSLRQVYLGGYFAKQQHVTTTKSKDEMTSCTITQSLLQVNHGGQCEKQITSGPDGKLKSLGATSPQKKL